MALIKLNNRSVKDATAFGSISSLGELTFISKQTASSSANISFTSGIDSTYKEYIFYFVNIHPETDGVKFQVNFRDGGTDYDATKTSTTFRSRHDEGDSTTQLVYVTGADLAQSTGVQFITEDIGNENDQCASGTLHLFNPSSTTFVKHFISTIQIVEEANESRTLFTAGYCNTTSAIDGVQFTMSSGNIDSGDIILFGLN
jgi:hypothetical protein